VTDLAILRMLSWMLVLAVLGLFLTAAARRMRRGPEVG
jgi:hypothetical protein